MAIAYVRELAASNAATGAGATTQAMVLTAGATAGDFVVLVLGFKSLAATTATITDTRGNTWTTDVGPHNANNNSILIASTKQNAAPLQSGDTVTVTLGGGTFAGGAQTGWWIEEFSGVDTVADKTALNDNASALTGTTGTTGTTTVADELVIAGITVGSLQSSLTAASFSPFTTGAQHATGRSDLGVYKIRTAAGTQSETFNWSAVSDFSTGMIATYKATASRQILGTNLPFIAPGRI